MENVLVTGGSGLIGQKLCRKLKEKGYRVTVLGRKRYANPDYAAISWDEASHKILSEVDKEPDYIIHLAGANIGEKRWTTQRKKEIIDSRVKTAQRLYELVAKAAKKPKAFISSSATGYYGAVTTEHIFSEEDPPASDFTGETSRLWEESALPFTAAGIRTVLIRTGVVLAPEGGALAKMLPLIRLGLGSPLGSGRQYFPWIHIDDLCNIYLKAIEDTGMHGPYNAVAPEIPTNREFFKTLAKVLQKPLWLPHVPDFVLKLLFGEMAAMLLEGSSVSPDKILKAGFQFRFPGLEGALRDLINVRGKGTQ